MVSAVLLALAILGAPPTSVLLTAIVWQWPPLGGAMVAGVIVAHRALRRGTGDRRELEMLDIAAQLRAGRTLREVMGSDADSSPAARLALAGRPMSHVVAARWGDDPQLGPLLGPALTMVSSNGGPVAPVFEGAAAMLIDDAAVGREVRMASAGPITQGVLVGGVPVLALVGSMVSGSFGERLEVGGVGAAVAVGGAVLTLIGGSVMGLLIRMVRK